MAATNGGRQGRAGKTLKRRKGADNRSGPRRSSAYRAGYIAACGITDRSDRARRFGLNEAWNRWFCRSRPGLRADAALYGEAMRSFVAGACRRWSRRPADWLLLPASVRVSALVLAGQDADALDGVLRQLQRLPCFEILILITDPCGSSFRRAMEAPDAAVVVWNGETNRGQAEERIRQMAQGDLRLLLHADEAGEANNAEQLVHLITAAAAAGQTTVRSGPHGGEVQGPQECISPVGMKTSIIIPSYNGLHLLAPCVESIRMFTPEPHEIIVVDNASTDGTAPYCAANGILLIRLPENRGFPAACNAGLRLASGDALLLLNNDVVVGPYWLGNLVDCLMGEPDVGIVGPMTNHTFGRQKSDRVYAGLEEYRRMAAVWNRPDPARRFPVKRIVGLCFLFRRPLMERIGLLDERFSPGYYEDDDYCYRARKAGYRLKIAGDVMVHHHGSASFKKEYRKKRALLIKTNFRKFMKKWGVNPHRFRA